MVMHIKHGHTMHLPITEAVQVEMHGDHFVHAQVSADLPSWRGLC